MSSLTLVTGANGFVGREVCAALVKRGMRVRALIRSGRPFHGKNSLPGVELIFSDLGRGESLNAALEGVDGVIHLAGRAHVLRETAANPAEEFQRVNVRGTAELAHAAVTAGVRRFVLASSIAVYGVVSALDTLSESTPLRPISHYGHSKLEAERILKTVCEGSPMSWSAIRPPLSYGPGVKGNFRTLLRWVDKRIPLPFAGIHNQRSFISVANLADAFVCCLLQEKAASEALLIRDGEDFSTPELINRIALHLGHRARLFSFPNFLVRTGLGLVGRKRQYEQLWGSLQLDDGRIRSLLQWSPPYCPDYDLRRMAETM